MNNKASFCILYLEIGRGHPFYLDGIVKALEDNKDKRSEYIIRDVFSLSRGISLFCWKIVRWLYRFGGRGGMITYFYNVVRAGHKSGRKGFLESLLGRDLRKYFNSNKMPVIVSHPILVSMLDDIVPVYYQHGELVCPDEAVTNPAEMIFVPIEPTKDCLIAKSIPPDKIMVSGLCLERGLAEMADICFRSRLGRLKMKEPLTAVFYSSGAEPPEHIKKIIAAAESLAKEGHRSIIFCREEGRLDRASQKISDVRRYVSYLPDGTMPLLPESGVIAVIFKDRGEEYLLTSQLFPLFDILVAPAHERSNWALGLGLPIFILYPEIGTFAPLNRLFLHKHGVAFDIGSISEANDFGPALNRLLQKGNILKAAMQSFGKYHFDGFNAICQYFITLPRRNEQ